jgi:hypothetical protein
MGTNLKILSSLRVTEPNKNQHLPSFLQRRHDNRHHAVCLTTGPQPFPKRALHRVRPSASSFNFQYLRFPLRSSGSCLRLRPPLSFPSTSPSITSCRRQFLIDVRQIQLSFLLFIVYTISHSFFTLFNTQLVTQSVQLIFSIFHQHHILKRPR